MRIKFTFSDGSVEYLDRDALRAILRRKASRSSGKLGGRPATRGRPNAEDILLRFSTEWLDAMKHDINVRARARAMLVKNIAAECDVEERTVRLWVKAALGD